jgi:hypothetical protein
LSVGVCAPDLLTHHVEVPTRWALGDDFGGHTSHRAVAGNICGHHGASRHNRPVANTPARKHNGTGADKCAQSEVRCPADIGAGGDRNTVSEYTVVAHSAVHVKLHVNTDPNVRRGNSSGTQDASTPNNDRAPHRGARMNQLRKLPPRLPDAGSDPGSDRRRPDANHHGHDLFAPQPIEVTENGQIDYPIRIDKVGIDQESNTFNRCPHGGKIIDELNDLTGKSTGTINYDLRRWWLPAVRTLRGAVLWHVSDISYGPSLLEVNL